MSDVGQLDFAQAAERAGFRLHRFEVFNWGTFNQRVWNLQPGGDNILLTGDIGSGKSTLVDAITTLLVPAQKIAYNKAAGADARERSLRTYVLGHYKSERGDGNATARAVTLRDHNSYSVLLSIFHNEGFDQTVTLAQVFWFKDPRGQPERFYIVADHALSVAEHFADFGADISKLRKRLRNTRGITLHESFTQYGADFRRRFGIANEQAMDLFHQTVSMKSVGNLTQFVRDHMLEAFPVEARIAALIAHFDDLNRAHESVLKAKAQISHLAPLIENCNQHARQVAEVEQLRNCWDALRPWFAHLKSGLLQKWMSQLHNESERLSINSLALADKKRSALASRDEIKQAIAANGGDRLERIRSDIFLTQQTKDERAKRAEQYDALAQAVGLSGAVNAEAFTSNRRAIEAGQAACVAKLDRLQDELTEKGVGLRQLEFQHNELELELASLRKRRSNIPDQMLKLRDILCDALDLSADDLPFVGELIQVRDEEKAWEGAAERLLHSFGISLLVPDIHYARLAAWVDQTHLGARLVYYRVRFVAQTNQHAVHPASLARKLAVKPESPFYNWLDTELGRRFDYVCCPTLDQFYREKRAITRSGQIKAGDERHEKDDRRRLDDRARYVLGWSNEAKIAVLEKQASDLKTRMQASIAQIAVAQGELATQQKKLGTWQQLAVFSNFQELEWRSLLLKIEQLEREKQQLEAASDVLSTLEQQLAKISEALQETESSIQKNSRAQGTNEEKLNQAESTLKDCELLLQAMPLHVQIDYFPLLEAMRPEVLGKQALTVETCDNREKDMGAWLRQKIGDKSRRIDQVRDKIIDAMRTYTLAYPLATREVDVSVEAAHEYRSMLKNLQSDDLPRFEARFKELLNENTIREIAGFQSQLHRERQTIRERIALINHSLRDIDYNPNRYIALEAEPNVDVELRDFQQNLRTCTEGALTGSADEEYSEAKFLQVRSIIERFRGREGSAEFDRNWTRKVTDVRNWFTFSASERWRNDDREHEHYTDSGGKSGGQKEKLAYTVLAASLAYQFGLEKGPTHSRSFRFVVIDEAFGRGSDESARYGLELFKRMNLQLLIVTPLQKIHIIEPYVVSLGFVHNDEGRQSMLRSLTIEEYQVEREARHAQS